MPAEGVEDEGITFEIEESRSWSRLGLDDESQNSAIIDGSFPRSRSMWQAVRRVRLRGRRAATASCHKAVRTKAIKSCLSGAATGFSRSGCCVERSRDVASWRVEVAVSLLRVDDLTVDSEPTRDGHAMRVGEQADASRSSFIGIRLSQAYSVVASGGGQGESTVGSKL